MRKHHITIRDGICRTDIPMPTKDGHYTVEITDDGCKTNQQMKYYRGPLIDCLKEYTGYTETECDAHFKTKFLDVETIKINGKEILVLPSLRYISKVKFAKFIDSVVEYLVADLKINPPLI